MKNLKEIRALWCFTPIAAAIAVMPAFAQTEVAQAESSKALVDAGEAKKESSQSVQITASKRPQFVIDVPYAVTAIGGTEIRDRGVTDIQQMQAVVPSLYINQNAPGASRIQLRGMSQGVGYGAALVGTYLDEISLNMPDAQRSLDVPLFDMARIEVLRGPQGTLYGDGSMGGAIRFITRDPRLDKFEANVEANFSQVTGGKSGWRTNAMLNIPLSADVAALRLVAGHEDIPGWIDNSASGAKDINGAKRDFMRGKLLFRASDKVDVNLSFFHAETDSDNIGGSNGDRAVTSYLASPTKDKTNLANLVVSADFGSVRLVSSTGYLDRKLDTTAEFTSTYRALFPPFLLNMLLPKSTSGAGYRQNISQKITTQEVRLDSEGDGALTWTAGIFFRKTDTHSITSDVWTDADFRLNGGYEGDAPTNVRQTALFGEVNYALAPLWTLTGGLRSFRETAENVGFKLPSGFAPPGTPPTFYNDEAKFHATTPRLSLLWRYSPESALYMTSSKGFRSGGFNASSEPRNYGPENILNNEIGLRDTLFGNRVKYEVAVYHSQYNNIQAQDLAPGCTPATCSALTVNTGKASGPGVDLTVSAALTKSLTLNLSMGFSDLVYDVTTAERSKGDPLNFVPKKTGSVSLSQRFDWASGMPGMFRLDYMHSDPVKFIVRNQGIDINGNSIDTISARIGLEMPTWQVYLEGRNLTDVNRVTFPGVFALPDMRTAPRTLGVTALMQF